MGKRNSTSMVFGVIVTAMTLMLMMAVPAMADEGDNKHPSGKDRSVENGSSGTQGNSTSDPDDDGRGPDRSNGGPDKPGGSGGVDQDDQDGNNGCGNDDDFEDDNEGWCGTKPKKEKEDEVQGNVTPTCPEIEAMKDKEKCAEVGGGAVVAPTTTECPKQDEMPSATKAECDEVLAHDAIGPGEDEVLGDTLAGDEVLGERITNESDSSDAVAPAVAAERSAGQVLPFTGAALLAFLGIAVGLIASGVLFWRKGRI
ncbi:MAG: hypothetical protein ACRDKT_13750 [Actinomycetota bacterium]